MQVWYIVCYCYFFDWAEVISKWMNTVKSNMKTLFKSSGVNSVHTAKSLVKWKPKYKFKHISNEKESVIQQLPIKKWP